MTNPDNATSIYRPLDVGDVVDLYMDQVRANAEVIHVPRSAGDPWGFRCHRPEGGFLDMYTLEQFTAYVLERAR